MTAEAVWKLLEHGVLQIKNICSSGCISFILNKDEAFKKTDSKP